MFLTKTSKIELPKPPAGYMYDDVGEIVKKPESLMGDRFYTQQLKATGSAPGSSKSKPIAIKAPTKAELVANFGVDISALTKADLQTVLEATPVKVTVPTGRLKAPYIAACKAAYGDSVDFSKLTVSIMTQLLNKVVL